MLSVPPGCTDARRVRIEIDVALSSSAWDGAVTSVPAVAAVRATTAPPNFHLVLNMHLLPRATDAS